MATARTYPVRRDNIGPMRDPVTILAPVVTRTASGGQRTAWVEWKTTRANPENLRGHEAVDAERPVAVNTKRFTVRSGSVTDINETMVIQHNDRYYAIERIDYREDLPHRMYTEITATRRDDDITPVDGVITFEGNQVHLGFAQRFPNVSAAYVTLTAGTLLTAADFTESQINQLLWVFRGGGQRLIYGSSGDEGFTINNTTNRITPNLSFVSETVLVQQYSIS